MIFTHYLHQEAHRRTTGTIQTPSHVQAFEKADDNINTQNIFWVTYCCGAECGMACVSLFKRQFDLVDDMIWLRQCVWVIRFVRMRRLLVRVSWIVRFLWIVIVWIGILYRAWWSVVIVRVSKVSLSIRLILVTHLLGNRERLWLLLPLSWSLAAPFLNLFCAWWDPPVSIKTQLLLWLTMVRRRCLTISFIRSAHSFALRVEGENPSAHSRNTASSGQQSIELVLR